ncbi:uncharacterized protein LOC125664077 isoform X2 [Ostrea edulis]|uniref:uncharacterized protein LOC125664077 isoform X2 n=1 Tax=Ostrea edulis TaxID=37623 RepID=UPI0024AF74A4|nr:uncharacterized protein LOC125664077 isoform X2 [Ostrea edulis]
MDFKIEKVCALKWKTSIFYTGILIILLLVHIVHGRENFYPVQSCTDITLAQIPDEVNQKCLEKNRVIHCLPDGDDMLGLSCFPIVWIAKGKCPYYNKYQENLDEKPCTGDAELCPPKQFNSPLSVLYKGCYIKELTTTRATSTVATTTQSMSTESRESYHSTHAPMCGISRTTCNESMLEMNSCSTETGFLIFFIITTVSLGMVIAVLKIPRLNVFCRNIVKCCRKENPKDKYSGRSMNGGENIPMAEGNNAANA